MDSETRLLYWLFYASRGGPTRLKIVKTLFRKPLNMHQLALSTELDYKTVQGHIKILLENGVVEQLKKGYGAIYFVNEGWNDNEYFNQILRGEDDGKKRKKG
jgi:DNA-binding transcriptional ArsR family regulator